MRPFKYSRSTTADAAIRLATVSPAARYLAGGTNLLDLMKEDVERPEELIDISGLPSRAVTRLASGVNKGGISIDALAKNTETANDIIVRKEFPLLSMSILAGASAQIRNMATNGGNLNQRTRCPYFYETSMPCNKREPGTGCGAVGGFNRMHAIFGWSQSCIAVHPSDMCVALAALEATVTVQDSKGNQRIIPFRSYHKLPGDTPETDNFLKPGELIRTIEIPKNEFAANSYYLKVRDRASYAFALLSVAAGLQLKGRVIADVKIALGGVAHKPWRAFEAEKFLVGKEVSEANITAAAELEMATAKGFEHNTFKIEMGKKAMVKAVLRAAGI